ncbi:MAG TPA: hypothetical protein VFQ53_13565 [Kofleriaceae bacterium]|nr:hypothetical protein [Kofleriaceae bacterium]
MSDYESTHAPSPSASNSTLGVEHDVSPRTSVTAVGHTPSNHKSPSAVNLPGRIVGVSQVTGGLQITINAGSERGVRVGMKGVIKVHSGPEEVFQIREVIEDSCRALIPITMHQQIMSGDRDVVINPRGKH